MGRERQKFKNKSSISKVRQKPKSKKKLLQNPIIAANWDQKQTLAQNYKRLGLSVKLNKQTGGIEKDTSDPNHIPHTKQDGLTIVSKTKENDIEIGEARVVRDPATGRILSVVNDDHEKENPLNDTLNELDSDEDEDEATWARLDNHHGNVDSSRRASTARTDVVRQLEERANLPAAKHVRPQSDNERAFIKALVDKYGDDYGKMERDMKLNYMQRSAGDLKKRVKKWKQNAGNG